MALYVMHQWSGFHNTAINPCTAEPICMWLLSIDIVSADGWAPIGDKPSADTKLSFSKVVKSFLLFAKILKLFSKFSIRQVSVYVK